MALSFPARPAPELYSTRRTINLRGDQLMRWAAFAALIFVLLGEFISPSSNPDYTAYEGIYEIDAENFATTSNGYCFTIIVRAAKYLGLDYADFRHCLRFVSIMLFMAALLVIGRWSEDFRGGSTLSFGSSLILALLVVGSVFVFGVEFFQIRLRAGLSVSLLALAFSLILCRPRRSSFGRLGAGVTLLGLSLGVHTFTGIVLIYLLLWPLVLSIAYNSLQTIITRKVSLASIAVILFASAIASLVYLCSNSADYRGVDLSSPLNHVRLLAIAIVPSIIVLGLLSPLIRNVFRFLRRPPQVSTVKLPESLKRAALRKDSWLYFASVNYLFLALALCVLAPFGLTQNSGEALVRIFTLSSVPAIFVIYLRPSIYTPLWIFLLTLNSLFFVNTLIGY
jgi:hypothetical protein